MYNPSQLFPGKELEQMEKDKDRKDAKFPNMSKVVSYFENSVEDVPSLILIELEGDKKNGSKRYTIGCFSPKSWSKKQILNRNASNKQNIVHVEGDTDDQSQQPGHESRFNS